MRMESKPARFFSTSRPTRIYAERLISLLFIICTLYMAHVTAFVLLVIACWREAHPYYL
jgi:hypothetical protein